MLDPDFFLRWGPPKISSPLGIKTYPLQAEIASIFLKGSGRSKGPLLAGYLKLRWGPKKILALVCLIISAHEGGGRQIPWAPPLDLPMNIHKV